jgi:hypothetical protein
MKTARTLLSLCLLVSLSAGLHGCITAATVVTIALVKNAMGHTATVEVEAAPKDVYAAMLRIVAKKPDVELVKQDDEKLIVEAKRGKNKATGKAVLLDNGNTKFTVRAKAGEKGQKDKALAQDIVENVCRELGVKYRVEEK